MFMVIISFVSPLQTKRRRLITLGNFYRADPTNSGEYSTRANRKRLPVMADDEFLGRFVKLQAHEGHAISLMPDDFRNRLDLLIRDGLIVDADAVLHYSSRMRRSSATPCITDQLAPIPVYRTGDG